MDPNQRRKVMQRFRGVELRGMNGYGWASGVKRVMRGYKEVCRVWVECRGIKGFGRV